MGFEPSRGPRLLYAVSAHGFGHLTRSMLVLRELARLVPELRPTVATAFEESVVSRELGIPYRHVPARHEPGIVQANCFESDEGATREAYREFRGVRESLLRRQTAQFQEVDFALCDVPAIAVRAAAAAGRPVVAISNFTWDWCLEPILARSPEASVLECLREDYACGDLWLRLPFSSPRSPFSRVEDAPLVGRVSAADPERVRRRLGCPPPGSRPLALVCASGWDATGWREIRRPAGRDLALLVIGDLPVRSEGPLTRLPFVLPGGIRFEDLVRSVDLVIAKPGYGIASECILNGTPLLGIERRGSPEARVLEDGLRRAGGFRRLSLEDFFAGRWQEDVEALLASTTGGRPPPPDGARRVAARIAAELGID